MTLSTTSVEEIFARMQVRYAVKFDRNYAGMDLAAVKADWAEVLDGFSVEAIRFGLVNLPIDWPPSAAEFRAICIRAPSAAVPEVYVHSHALLPGVSLERDEKLAILAKMRALFSPGAMRLRLKAWADERREGEPITQRAMREATRAADTPVSANDREQTKTMQKQAANRVAAYAKARPEAMHGWTQEQRDNHQRMLDKRERGL